jgi:hypothetical protein
VQVIKKLLKKHFFKRRKTQKKETLKQVAGCDEQFIRIAELKALYRTTGNLIISMDTKKKELLGNFYRDGNPASCLATTILTQGGIADLVTPFKANMQTLMTMNFQLFSKKPENFSA